MAEHSTTPSTLHARQTNHSPNSHRHHHHPSPPAPPHHHHGDHHQGHHRQHHHHQHQQQQQQLQQQEQLHQQPQDGGEERRLILIAMDGSPHSFYAFDWYMHHVHTAHNEVIVAHSCPSTNNILAHAQNLMPSVSSEEPCHLNRLAKEEEVNQIVARIKGRLATSGVRGRLMRLSGDPGPAIVQAAKEVKAVCIVTGSRGLGTVKRTLIGSVSDFILHHSHCPVLVCRHKDHH